MKTNVGWNVYHEARKLESKAIPIFLLSRLREVTGCSCSTSNVSYYVKCPLVQDTVGQVGILRGLGTKTLPLLRDESPVRWKQKHCLTPDTSVM